VQKRIDSLKQNQKALSNNGWAYLVVWECQLKDYDKLSKDLRNFLNKRITSN
jgi:G:T-mismatch repair DNA endonuclease (very short patch repair protein)